MKRNYKPENTIVNIVKIDDYTDELDFAMYSDILGEENVDNAMDEDGIQFITKGYQCDNHPVKIEELEKFLEKAKKAGCNYISIDYNCDHPDYTLYGIDIHQASQEEIDEVLNEEKSEKQKKADELRKKAELLNKEAENLEKE